MRALFLILIFASFSGSIDPIEAIVRNFLLQAKSVSEKFLSSIEIPTSSNLMFQMDEKNVKAVDSLTNFFNTCPPYMMNDLLNGTWFITHMNKKLLQTTFSDLDETIDDLSMGLGLSSRKTLKSLFRDGVIMYCANVTILTDTTISPFQLEYSTPKGRKSIIGNVWRAPDRSVQFSFVPNVVFRGIISYRTFTIETPEVLIFSDTDTYPKCDSYMVLKRKRNTTGDDRLLEMLTATGANFPSNPLLSLDCSNIIN
ncbi:unnamed protein product [Auanema sp. JU1783]|nr:unnamed protein product [Auanema sp. JU1783]